MAQLSSIIGSILRDIISAQHEANLYSISLSENYGKDGKTKDFQLPNVVLSDMEMELKYGVISAEESKEEHNIKYSKYREFLRSLCADAAKTAITSVVSTVLSSDIRRGEDETHFFVRLKQEDELYRKFRDFLVRNLRVSFSNNLHETIDVLTGNVLTDKLTEKMTDVIRKKFLDDSELDTLFSGADGQNLKSETMANLKTVLGELIRKEADGINFKRTKSFSRLDVAVTAEELERMPEDAIHSFKLKFSPNTCTVSSWEDEDELENFVMKQ